ncbi:MAG: hypothetical protein ACYSU0_12085 [Planctomycetota bacterium]|jgi:hypothetical protein
MLSKGLALVLRNLARSRTRLIATVGGCAVAAFVVCFFLAADNSLSRVLSAASESSNLVVRQKDRY